MDQDDIDALLALASGADDDDDEDLADMLSDIVSGESEFISGDTEFVGNTEYVGRRARRRGAARTQLARAQAVAKIAQMARNAKAARVEREGVHTVRAYGDRARRTFAGGNVTLITASGQVVVKTQETIRPDRMVITAVQRTAASGNVVLPYQAIQINDIKHGTRSQFSSNSPINAALLTPEFFANGSDLGLDTIQAGTDLTLFLGVLYPAIAIDANNPVDIIVSIQGRTMR